MEALGGSTEGGRDLLAVMRRRVPGIVAAAARLRRVRQWELVLDVAAREEALSARAGCGRPHGQRCRLALHSSWRRLPEDLGHPGASSRCPEYARRRRPPCRHRQPPPPTLMNHLLDRAGGFHALKATNVREIWEEAMVVGKPLGVYLRPY